MLVVERNDFRGGDRDRPLRAMRCVAGDQRRGVGGAHQRFEREVVGVAVAGRLADDHADPDALGETQSAFVDLPVLKAIREPVATLAEDVRVVAAVP